MHQKFYPILVAALLGIMALTACDRLDSSGELRTPEATQDYRTTLLGEVSDPAKNVGDFTLPATTGEDFTLSEQTGKITVVFFGYTVCPDVCPGTMTELRRAYLELEEPRDKLNVVFITIDPERDTLETLQAFTGIYSADFVGLYAESDTLEQLQDRFGVFSTKVPVENSSIGYTMDHTGDVFILAANGDVLVRFFYGATAFNFEHDLKLILEHEL